MLETLFVLQNITTVTQVLVFVLGVIFSCFSLRIARWAIFESYFIKPVKAFFGKDEKTKEEIFVLNWELINKVKFHPALVNKETLVNSEPLHEDELKARYDRLRKISFEPWYRRMINYFLSCTGCQQLWVAIIGLLLFSPWLGVTNFILSATAYTGLCVFLLDGFLTKLKSTAEPTLRHGSTCPGK